MKTIMIKLMIMNSSMITLIKNPLSMGFTLIMQTMLMVILMNKMSKTAWFSMLTFLMMIGGLLILFTYMSSIASNEKMKTSVNITLMMLMMLTIMDEMMIENQMEEKQEMMKMLTTEKMSMIKLFNTKSMTITILMILYLLLSMISVSKIINHHEGPLRTKF
uniref:NADH dehydrogenase subunit 6 n=1 Tax=Xestocephalus biprocessus TaxID=3112134 RepID=UPI002E792410|nr:NADH dehydrogenase subunit 6 [Xestocephalus biprocessus]WRK21294.1 NADH dehydrogenase subunit 6 [Xestocephalus biprocessus]